MRPSGGLSGSSTLLDLEPMLGESPDELVMGDLDARHQSDEGGPSGDEGDRLEFDPVDVLDRRRPAAPKIAGVGAVLSGVIGGLERGEQTLAAPVGEVALAGWGLG